MSKGSINTECLPFSNNKEKRPLHERVGFVTFERMLSAGTGLSGGGYLNNDVSFCVDFGEKSYQVPRGNDKRFTDSREWIAEEVEEDEAKEGTCTQPRKWSAKSVHQAIEGWWESSNYRTQLNSIVQNTQTGVSGGVSSFARVKEVFLVGEPVYVLTVSDIGKTIVFPEKINHVEIEIPACLGSLGDEIYIIAPAGFIPTQHDLFYTRVGDQKVLPRVATGTLPTFRDGHSIVCLKKVFSHESGAASWLLFGDLQESALGT